MILQHIYKPILNFIYDKATYKIPEKARNVIIFLSFLMIFAVQFLAQYVFLYHGLNRGIRDYVICLLLGIIILVSVNGRLELLKWRKTVYIPFTATGLLLLIASLDHDMGVAYQAFPLVMLVAFMCLYYVWGNRGDYSALLEDAAKAYVMFITVIFIMCVIYFPYYSNTLGTTPGYSPFSMNPNGTAKIFLPGIVCGLFLSLANDERKSKYLYAAVAGASAGVVILTDCRAGIICLALLGIFYIVSMILSGGEYDVSRHICKKNVVRNCILLITVLLMCVAGMVLVKYVSPEINQITAEDTAAVADEPAGESTTAEKDERKIIIEERLKGVYEEIHQSDVLTKLDTFTSGRISIWTVYVHNMTWKGSGEFLFHRTEFAHNQYIELSYKAGIMTGIVYLIFNIIVGIYLLVNLCRRGRRTKYLYFQLFTYLAFFIISMLDTGILPFERGFIFLYYISLTPLFIKKSKE